VRLPGKDEVLDIGVPASPGGVPAFVVIGDDPIYKLTGIIPATQAVLARAGLGFGRPAAVIFIVWGTLAGLWMERSL
jgi:hypothetical protein